MRINENYDTRVRTKYNGKFGNAFLSTLKSQGAQIIAETRRQSVLFSYKGKVYEVSDNGGELNVSMVNKHVFDSVPWASDVNNAATLAIRVLNRIEGREISDIWLSDENERALIGSQISREVG